MAEGDRWPRFGRMAEAEARGVVRVFWQRRYDLTIGAYSTQYVDGVNGIPDGGHENESPPPALRVDPE